MPQEKARLTTRGSRINPTAFLLIAATIGLISLSILSFIDDRLYGLQDPLWYITGRALFLASMFVFLKCILRNRGQENATSQRSPLPISQLCGKALSLLLFSISAYYIFWQLIVSSFPKAGLGWIAFIGTHRQLWTAAESSQLLVDNIVVLLLIGIVQPFIEETILRGYLFRYWTVTRGIREAILVSAFWSAVIHPGNPIGAAAVGAVLALVTIQTGSIRSAIIIHSLLALTYLGIESVGLFAYQVNVFDPKHFQTGFWAGIVTLFISGPFVFRTFHRNLPEANTPSPVLNFDRLFPDGMLAPTKRNFIKAFFLSLAAPGLGQFYNARLRNAFAFMGLFLLIASIAVTLRLPDTAFGLRLSLALCCLVALAAAIDAALYSIQNIPKSLRGFQRWNVEIFLLLLLPIPLTLFAKSELLFQLTGYEIKAVSSASMYPSLEPGKFVMTKTIEEAQLQRSDIVTFTAPSELIESHGWRPDQLMLKRIIAPPGDTVEIVSGKVKLNGHELGEPYVPTDLKRRTNLELVTVPASKIFVLGDNRDNSLDSRDFKNKFIDLTDVRGHLLYP